MRSHSAVLGLEHIVCVCRGGTETVHNDVCSPHSVPAAVAPVVCSASRMILNGERVGAGKSLHRASLHLGREGWVQGEKPRAVFPEEMAVLGFQGRGRLRECF